MFDTASINHPHQQIESLQTAVGNQEGQLSSTLPSLVHELQEMAGALQDLLEVQAASVAAPSRAGTVTADELLDVLAPIMTAVQKLSQQPPDGDALQREVQQVTGAVQVLVGCMLRNECPLQY